jgi:hypothetical protein
MNRIAAPAASLAVKAKKPAVSGGLSRSFQEDAYFSSA